MKLIKSVEILEVSDGQGHVVQVAHHRGGVREMFPSEPHIAPRVCQEIETCRGRLYKDDSTGQHEWIAMTKEAKHDLGFPFDQFELSLIRSERLQKANWGLVKAHVDRLRRIKEATLWERLRYLVKREVPK